MFHMIHLVLLLVNFIINGYLPGTAGTTVDSNMASPAVPSIRPCAASNSMRLW